MSYTVVTHSGKAHMDELIGITLLAVHFNSLPDEIIRVEHEDAVKLAENKSEETFFIDCGMDYNPKQNIFDHHHNVELGSAALLIFDYFFSELKDSRIHGYIKLVSDVDTRGPNALDDFKFNSDTIDYFSFSQKIILKEFEHNPLEIVSIFYRGLKSRIIFEEERKDAMEWLLDKSNIEIECLNGVNILKYNKVPPYELSRAIKSADSEIIENENIHIIYSFDKDDNSIRTLYRTLKADNILNLTRSDVKDTIFCHPGGFLLKFRPYDINEWIKIIKESRL